MLQDYVEDGAVIGFGVINKLVLLEVSRNLWYSTIFPPGEVERTNEAAPAGQHIDLDKCE